MSFQLPVRSKVTFDLEVYRNYFLCMFKDFDTRKVKYFEQHTIGSSSALERLANGGGATLDIERIKHFLRKYTLVSFNGNNYDAQILALALDGASCSKLKDASDHIIVGNLKPWEFREEYGVQLPGYVDHIDLIEVAPGQASLKLYGGRLHSKTLQDLPIEPDALITLEDLPKMRAYCANDNDTTIDLALALADQIELRTQMSHEYKIDLRSKSDAQIAEAVIASQIQAQRRNMKIVRPKVSAGTKFRYQIPNFINYKSEVLQKMLEVVRASDFIVDKNGSVLMPKQLEEMVIRIGRSAYQMGIGGLHSTEKSQGVVADANHFLIDRDVASYYPAIILLLKLFPKHLGEAFLAVYRGIVEKRLKGKTLTKELKKLGDMDGSKLWAGITQTLKIVINGSFGKLGSKWSKLYSPDLMIQVTITGQLSLLMLIEMLEAEGLSVVSANTDGVVIYGDRSQQEALDDVIFTWELETGFETEDTPYKALYSRDVNSYIAIKPNGECKTKGEFAMFGYDDPFRLSVNPSNTICVEAVTKFLADGVPLARTVLGCDDVRKFLSVRRVNGGGLLTDLAMDNKPTLSVMAECLLVNGWYPMDHTKAPGRTEWIYQDKNVMSIREAYETLKLNRRHEYLGKVVRWYYGRDSKACITYKTNGNKVSRSEGCVPLMTLPDEMPDDIDYNWYIEEAQAMLSRIGYVAVPDEEECEL